MKTLLLIRRDKSGAERTYRFSAENGRFVIGSSRKADVRLSKASSPIEGVIERTEKGWYYHSFAIRQNDLILDLANTPQFSVSDAILIPKIIPDRSFFTEAPAAVLANPPPSNEKSDLSKADMSKSAEQMILVYFHGELWTSRVCPTGETCTIDLYTSKISVKTSHSSDWKISTDGDYEIRQKTIPRINPESFNIPLSDYVPRSKKDRWMGAAFASYIVLVFIAGFFGAKKSQLQSEVEPPKSESPIVVKLSPTQQKPKPKEDPAQAKSDKSNAAPANRMDQLRNLASVSKAGLFLKKGVRIPTSIGPNGKLALAAAGVGRLDGPTTDWNAMAGSKVSGKVGGGLSGGNGTGTKLSAGGTGSSGVGLLEQEGEVTGGLDKEIIAAFIRKNIGHILYCYERSLSANPNLFGKVSVRFVIGGSGKVETQKIGETTLKNGQVETCILDKVSQWKFPEPKGGVQVVVTYPFLFKTTN